MRSRRILISLSLVIVAAALSATAAQGARELVAKTTLSASSISWSSTIEHERLVLTVQAPDGSVFSREFVADAASLRLSDFPEKNPADGIYTYDLRVVPHIGAGVLQKLALARAKNDDAAVERIRRDAGLDREAIQSGAFTIASGRIVSGDTTEPRASVSASSKPASGDSGAAGNSVTASARPLVPKATDQVIADDLIVQGSACVGLDCVNNEAFGFDTIRLKENNTRILFFDTSTAAGFPNHHWQLTANDSNSGGAEKFSIEDITAATVPFTITGSAPTNSVFVSSAGKVGFHNSTPVLDLHVTTGNTPAIRLEQNTSGGFSAQTWDIGANEANFFVRDVTSGSRLPLRIRPGAPTSSIDISASGNVGVGTASPVSLLDVRGANGHVLVGSGTSDFLGGAQTGFGASNGTEKLFFGAQTGLTFLGSVSTTNLGIVTNNSTKLLIDTAGNVGINCLTPAAQLVIASGGGCNTPSSSINAGSAQFTVASSRTFKDNIAPVKVSDILTKIESVPVVTYDFKNNGPKDRLGLIAEDFHQVFQRGDAKYIDGQEVQMALWLAVQQLSTENKALTERLNTLEKQLAAQPKTQQ
jgi:hypothetical protein